MPRSSRQNPISFSGSEQSRTTSSLAFRPMPLPSHGATKASRGPQLLWGPSPRRACVLPTPHPRSPFLRHVTPRLDQSVTLSLDSFPMTTIDKDALQLKYAEERAKRLRPDGNDQYLELKDQFAHYARDPYMPLIEREPKTDHVTVAFVGGGFAGLITGARLKED